MTRAYIRGHARRPRRRLERWLGPLLVLAVAAAAAQDATQQLQQQQQRERALRQQSVRENLRQQSQRLQIKATADPQLRSQLEATDRVQYQQYKTRREDLIRQYPALPRPSQAPVPPPADAASTVAPVHPALPATVSTPAAASSTSH